MGIVAGIIIAGAAAIMGALFAIFNVMAPITPTTAALKPPSSVATSGVVP